MLRNIFLITAVALSFSSCEKDFASIDSDVVNSDNTSNFGTDFLNFPVKNRQNNVCFYNFKKKQSIEIICVNENDQSWARTHDL